MSKTISSSITKIRSIPNGPTKFSASAKPGSRLLPSRTMDASVEVRIDAGHFDENTKRLNVVLQVKSQAKSPALVDFKKKEGTHAKLATESFDTTAKDKDAEADRVYDSMESQAKEKLG
ncbi:MAG: hypothetical protein Q9221_004208 [Calogaya cf. arnoldii]